MHPSLVRLSPRRALRPTRARRLLASAARAGAAALALLVAAVPLGAQMPGVPVLQNAFTAPGIVVAANGGATDGAKTFGLAGSWTAGSGRFVLSGGAGWLSPDEGDGVVAWGARVALPIPRPSAGNFGVGMFVGVGGADPDAGSIVQIPAGLSVGWRRGLGATRALSVYAAPFYNWSRATIGDESVTAGHVRLSAGLDVAFSPSWGLTLGVEAGQEADADEPGPTGTGFGLGVSFAFGRAR